MLRICRRTDQLVRLAAVSGVHQSLRSVGPRCLSTTPATAAKAGSARKKRQKKSRSRGQSSERSRKASSTKSQDRAARIPASESLDQQNGIHTNLAQVVGVVAATSQTLGADGEPIENGSNDQAPAQRGAGIWTSLRARLQGSRPDPVAEDEAMEVSDEDARLHDSDKAMAPVDSVDDDEKVSKRGATAKGKKAKSKEALGVKTIKPQRLRLRPVEDDIPPPVPKLSHNLDRVLFNPGVYHIQDPRSRVFNFDPYLSSIMPVDEFDFDALKSYVTSSKDVKLRQLSAAHGMKYCGSTSSMTSILSHFHFLLSAWRKPHFDCISRSLHPESLNYTALSRGPAAAFAHFSDGVYAIDADKEYDTENILSMLGKSMEKLLTLPKEEFEKYRRTRSHQISEEERNSEEAFHYTTMGDFMMRSQLDAHDHRLPGSGMFDLKTRAVVSIRMDVRGYEKGVGYEIRNRFGQWESFEREYYDMIRAAFLKYSLQVRMGRMDGIFVAFHNTQRIFGFQYISLEEMDQAIHGAPDRRLGDQEFKASLALLNDLLNRATERFPGRTLRLHVETRPTKVPLTYFFVEPVTEEEMIRTQEAGKLSVEQLERDILSLGEKEPEAESDETEESAQVEQTQPEDPEQLPDDSAYPDAQSDVAWNIMMAKVDETVENESLGIGSVREAVQDALEQSGLLRDKSELETEQYLDAMVSSLTSHSSKIKELRDRPDEAEESAESTQQRDTEKNVDGSSSETLSASTQSEDSEPTSSASDTTTPTTSLKDLILKVTEGIGNKTQNLKTFQRMFADLATHSKQPDPESHDQTSGVSETSDVTADEEKGLEDATEDSAASAEESEEPHRELLGMYVTIRNKVNGEYVDRPDGNGRGLDWAIQYAITELPDKRAQQIYTKIKNRRKAVLLGDATDRADDWHKMFKGRLPIITKNGEKYREKRTQEEAGNPVYVAWDKEPLLPEASNGEAKATDESG